MSAEGESAPAPVLVSRTTPLDEFPDLIGQLPASGGIAWLRNGEGFVAWGQAATVYVGTGPDRFERAASAVAGLLGPAAAQDEVGAWATGPLAFGSFAFDADSPASEIVIPSVVIGYTQGRAWMTRTSSAFTGPADNPVSPVEPTVAPALDEDSFVRAVESARDAIREGRLEKVVLSLKVAVEAPAGTAFDQPAALRRLAAEYPQCYTFAFGSLIGASPELLVRREGRSIHSMPLAGSARRGATAEEDDELGRRLLASRKDRWEHDLAVVTVVEALHPFCRALRIDPEPSLMRLANVQHLATKMSGELSGDPPPSALQIAGAVHPSAAVCGTPTRKALALIRELEGPNRGRYAGPVGWVDAHGNGEWAIALRCAEVSASAAHLFAGAGIVSESDPASELEETRLKLRPIRSALQLI